jgi:quercetin dioxygenase-like cupin family protein
MDRKRFITASGLGISLALIPGIVKSQNACSNKSNWINSEPKIVKEEEGNIINVIGDIQTHKLAGSDTGNQIVEWVNEVGPGVGIPPHIHTKEDEIFRVLKGEIEIMVGDNTTILKEGDIAFAPKNVVHSWRIVGTEKASMCTSAFPAGIEHMFTELDKLPPGPPNFEKVSKICQKYGISFV